MHGCLPSSGSERNPHMPHHRSSSSGQVGFISRPARCDPGCCDQFQGTEGANRCSAGQTQRPVAAVQVQLSFSSLVIVGLSTSVPAFGTRDALATCYRCKAGKAHQCYDGPQALTVKQQAFNLLNTGQYRGGSPISDCPVAELSDALDFESSF